MPVWLTTWISHWSFKVVSVLLIFALVAVGVLYFYKTVDTSGFQRGYQQALKDHPQNVYNGPATINQQPCPTPNVFGLDIGKVAFGLIFKR